MIKKNSKSLPGRKKKIILQGENLFKKSNTERTNSLFLKTSLVSFASDGFVSSSSANDLLKKKKRKSFNMEDGKIKENKRTIDDSSQLMGNEAFSNEDPFTFHFGRNLSKDQAKEIGDLSSWNSSFVNWPTLNRIKCQIPPSIQTEIKPRPLKRLLLEDESNVEDNILPIIGILPNSPFSNATITSKAFLHSSITQRTVKSFTSLQREMYSVLSQYIDFYYPYSSHDKWDKVRLVYVIHCLNHVLKTSKQIVFNNVRLQSLSKSNEEGVLLKDQGFTRPKILILVPFKNSAYRVVKDIITVLKMEVMYKKRFLRDFASPTSVLVKQNSTKPVDFTKIFEGDIKEDFKIGITVTKKNIKLYSEFSQSDIIIASPLGLRFSLDTAKSVEEVDFLSSIEVVVLDQADIFLMQNWEHILIILEAVNKFPKNLQNLSFDLYRVRSWCMDGLSNHYRQTICFSSINHDYVRSIIAKSINFAGKMEVLNLIPDGSLSDVTVNAELILQRVKAEDLSASCYDPNSQFNFFVSDILPRLRSQNLSHTLIYVPDYCDYIRVVRYLKEDGGTSIATINEYMVEENSKVAKARSLFYEGKRRFLIYTERFHFYRRYKIKGIQHIVFYGLPTYPHFFPEICNFMVDELQNPKEPPPSGLKTITVPFQRFDTAKLVALLGAFKAAEIINSDKTIHRTVTAFS